MTDLGKRLVGGAAFAGLMLVALLSAIVALDAWLRVARLKRQLDRGAPAAVAGRSGDERVRRLETRMVRLETDVVQAMKRNDQELERVVAEKVDKIQTLRERDRGRREQERLFRGLRPDMQGFIGVHVTGFEADVAAYFGLKDPTGALIMRVIPLSPAEKAGLHVLDLITRVNNRDVEDAFEFRNMVRALPPGSKARIEVLRMRAGRVTLPVDVARFSDWLAEWEDPHRLSLRIRTLEREVSILEKALNLLSMKLGQGQAVGGRPSIPSHFFKGKPAAPAKKNEEKAGKSDDVLKEW